MIHYYSFFLGLFETLKKIKYLEIIHNDLKVEKFVPQQNEQKKPRKSGREFLTEMLATLLEAMFVLFVDETFSVCISVPFSNLSVTRRF